jgi:endonuclease VIII
MPEGDSIFRAAQALHRALAGKDIVRFESVLPLLTRVHEDHPLTGRTIESVTSAGKHLLMRFSGGLVLRTHMRMNGSWHIYRAGERWQRPRRDMRVVIATKDFEAVGFNLPVAEFLTEHEATGFSRTRLGPDLLSSDFDRDEALRRLRANGRSAIADAILEQRSMAGIGNVYKSEVLFLCRINPFTDVDRLDDSQLMAAIDMARKLLHINVTTELAPMTTYSGLRRTTGRRNPSDRLWVYGRARRPCRRCGTLIESRKQGPNARSTYWCPTCQPS